MHTFKDNGGRTWVVAIHVAAVRKVKGFLGLDLYGLLDEKFEGLAKLLGDPCTLVDVLFVLCKEEADKLGVSDEDFGRAMGGDALQLATDAFLEELTDFFPDPRVRAGIAKMLKTSRGLADRLMANAMDRLESLDLDDVARRLIGSSGISPASSASTPGPSRSAS